MGDRTREETVHSSPSTTPHLPLPGKKIQSHSQQLTHIGSHNSNSLLRKHSLEEDRFLLFGGHEYKTRFAEEEKHAQEQEQKEDDEHSTISHSSSYNATTTFHQNSKSRPLTEFIGAGGNDGIFKIPARAAIPPGRPPSLELRSRPLRDTQMGSFLKVISCSDSQLWAGHESGVRCWNLSDMYMTGGGEVVRTGDEDTAPFYESDSTCPVICMTMGKSSNVVWSGHKDGIIRLWNINQSLDGDGDGDGNGNALAEDLMWRAHRGPVLSLTMTSYGDLWAGCEGGVIKVWPWETVEQSLSLKQDEKDVAALLLERSYLDLRTKATVNGVCALSHADVLYLLSDISRAKVWSAGHHSFALWDARNRELLKVFNIDGQITRVDMPSTRDASVEDENKTKLSSNSKKEKSQSSLTFLQRSRNAIMGAADAVRRVAVKGTFTDDNQRTEALVLTGDGMIWTGCFSGLLVQWDGNGSRLRDFNHHPFPVRCLCAIGAKIWVGYVTGTVQVLNLNGALLGEWIAHNAPIINMSVGAGYVFTLASHGGIRGWNIVSPGPLDDILRSEISCRESSYTKLEKLKLLVGTWNVGQGKASNDSLLMWLGSVASDISIVVVGLQEVEMGAGFLAMSAARETVGIEGTSIGHWWLDTIGKQLDEGETFERIGSRQLAGLLIALWARKNHRSHIGDIDAAAVPCGFGHAIGNKGGVGLRVRVYDRILCFVNCHLAAHLEAVNRRNSDFSHIYRTMTFNRPNQINGSNGASSPTADSHQAAVGVNSEDRKPELSEADMVVFLGDLNYRLHGISYEEAKDFVSQRCFDWLKERDQLTAEMKAGKVFQGMREGLITFPPTYKFEKRLGGLGGYDSSEKKRIPAWCDRVLYRDNRVASETKCCLDCPVVSSILQYEACMDVTDSDHKPVRCIFSVDIASIDESARRQNFGWIIQSNEKRIKECSNDVPETTVSTNNIIFQGKEKLVLRISNACQKSEAYFEIVCEGQSTIKKDGQGYEHHPRGSFGFPRWLQVSPAAGVIKSGKSAEISMSHEESCTLAEFVDGIPQNWWCEDARGKEVILALRVRGSCSPATETHQIRVSHSFASMSKEINSKPNDGRTTRLHHLDSLLQAADTQQSSLTLAMKESRENEIRKNKAGAFQSKSLQEPILRNQNSTSNAADTKHSFHTTSLDGNVRNGARNNGDAGVETMTLSQHLNCSSSDAETHEISHTLSIEENIKKEDRRNTTGEAQSKSLQGADLQCRNSSSHEDNTEPSSHTRLTEEKDNHGARRTKGAESQSKARQQSDLTSDTADSQGKGKIGICNAGEIQPETIQHAELQHLTLTSHEDGTQPSLRTWLPEEKNNHGARRTKGAESQSKARQQSDLTSDTAVSQQNLQIAPTEGKSKFGTRSAGELQSKIVQHVDMPTSNAGDTQHSSRSPSTVEMEKNGAGRRDTKGIQCDVQPYADGIQNNFSTASTEEKGRSGARENDVGRIQSKPIQQPFARSSNTSRGRGNSREIQPESSQQPDLQYLNPFFDESETQNSSHITEKGTNGDREIQPKILEQPDLRHLNPFSDAGDIQHSLPDPATNGASKNRAQENNDEETKPKIREQSDLRHLNPFSDAGDYQRSLHNPSTEGTSKAGAREKNAEGIQPKMLEQPDLQHRNPFSDAPDNHHSLQDPPTNRMNQTGAQVNNPKGPERPNLQHFNPFSDVTDNQHSSHTPSTNITSRNGAQGNKAKGVQQPGMQHRHLSLDATDDIHGLPNPSTEPDQLHLNPFSDAEDDQHNLHNPSTKRTSGDGVQGNNARETDSQSTSLVQPDMQYLSRSSGAADTQYRLRTTTTEDKNKNRGQENNAKGITRKSLQQPDLPQRKSPSDGAECQQELYNPSTEGNRKTGDRENNSKGNQPKPLQKPDLQHLDCFYDAAGTQHIQHMPLEEERSKSGAQNNNAGRTQSKTSKQTGSENMVNDFFDAADSQHSLNTPATKERSKNAAQENNATTTQSKMPAQSDVQHHSHPSGKADTENRSRTQLTVENNKKGGQENFTNKGIQTFEQPDLQHPSQLSGAVATEHKVQTPSKEKKNKNDAREKKTGGSQPKTLQQPDSQPLPSSPDRPETQQSLFTVLTKKKSKGKSKKGTQQDSAKGSQSMCQQPDSQNLDPSSETYSPRTSSTKDKSKSKSKKDSANGVQSMTLQQPDSSQLVRLCDAAATHRSLNTPTVEEKIKTRARKLYLP